MDRDTKPAQQGRQTEVQLDTSDVLKTLVKFHENLKEMHYELLKPLGLGEAHQRGWEALDNVRERGIEILRRRNEEQQQTK